MVERGAEVFGAAAVALVKADDVEAGEPGLFGGSPRVAGFTGALEAVNDDERGMRLRGRLPVAVAADLGAGFRLKIAGDAWAEARRAPGPKAGGDGHRMAVAERAERAEFLHFEYGMRGAGAKQRGGKCRRGPEGLREPSGQENSRDLEMRRFAPVFVSWLKS